MEICAKEQLVYDVLNGLEIEYKLFRHEAVFTVEAAADLDRRIGVKICKNLFLSSRHNTEFFLLTMPGDKKFNTGKVSKYLGVPRMTFAYASNMEEFLNVTPGSVTPLGLINDKYGKVRFLIDREDLEMEKISVHPCVNTATVLINTKVLLEKVLPHCGHDYTVVEF